MMMSTRCPPGKSEIILKTFPSIDPIKHSNLTKWKYDSKFCAAYATGEANFSLEATCEKPKSYCSGFCTSNYA